MKILVGCERSGSLQKALISAGFDAIGCDIQSPGHSLPFIQDDIRNHLSPTYDILFVFPPCTYLSKVQIPLIWSKKERYLLSLQAAAFCKELLNSPIHSICLENPPGMLSSLLYPPSQIVRPCHFGDPYSTAVALWLKNLPPLISTVFNPITKSVDNQVNSRMSQVEKGNIRSIWERFPGLCTAIASQMTVLRIGWPFGLFMVSLLDYL